MNASRRSFLKTAGAAMAAGGLAGPLASLRHAQAAPVTKAALDKILETPTITTDFVKEPVTVASIELLVNGKNFLIRTRSAAGVEALTVPNPERMSQMYPVFLKNVVPVFLKQ